MAKRNVVDFKIINLSEEKFQELKEAGQIDPNALYTTPDTTKERLDALESRATNLEETKQDKATAVNYDNITNCITEIPQDIKLELNNGTLTLKAGSKVYVPNGAGVFDVVNITSDKSFNATEEQNWFLAYDVDNGVIFGNYNNSVNIGSGTTEPPAGFYGFYYNTSTNLLYDYRNGVKNRKCSLPFCIATSKPSSWSISQVFNGFGYIGSTVFVLPGVKGLIPNGRNEDGTLKNITANNASVKTVSGWIANSETIQIATDGTVYTSGSLYYDPKQNICLNHRGEQTLRLNAGAVIFGTNGKITFFESKTAFHAVDYSNTEFIANQAMPSSKYVDFTLGASGTQYTAPADGYMCCVISTTINGFISMYSNYWRNGSADGAYVGGWVPVRKGVAINVFYEGLIQVIEFRFRYAVGAK